MSPALAGQFFTTRATWEAPSWMSGFNCGSLFSDSFTGQKSEIRVWAGLVPSESWGGGLLSLACGSDLLLCLSLALPLCVQV